MSGALVFFSDGRSVFMTVPDPAPPVITFFRPEPQVFELTPGGEFLPGAMLWPAFFNCYRGGPEFPIYEER